MHDTLKRSACSGQGHRALALPAACRLFNLIDKLSLTIFSQSIRFESFHYIIGGAWGGGRERRKRFEWPKYSDKIVLLHATSKLLSSATCNE